MDSDAYYIADITQAIALFQNVGGYESDAEGVFFSDPVDHMPLRYDLYDANKKYADSRNIAVVGMTGGGKTVTLEKVVDAYHHDKTAEYINIIVDCGGSYDKAARLYDPEEVFTFRYSPSEALDSIRSLSALRPRGAGRRYCRDIVALSSSLMRCRRPRRGSRCAKSL